MLRNAKRASPNAQLDLDMGWAIKRRVDGSSGGAGSDLLSICQWLIRIGVDGCNLQACASRE
jgi:hypothetical protein